MGELMFSGDVLVYLLGLAATWGAVMWRIAALEKKVEKHNSMIERTYKLEGEVSELQHDVMELKDKQGGIA